MFRRNLIIITPTSILQQSFSVEGPHLNGSCIIGRAVKMGRCVCSVVNHLTLLVFPLRVVCQSCIFDVIQILLPNLLSHLAKLTKYHTLSLVLGVWRGGKWVKAWAECWDCSSKQNGNLVWVGGGLTGNSQEEETGWEVEGQQGVCNSECRDWLFLGVRWESTPVLRDEAHSLAYYLLKGSLCCQGSRGGRKVGWNGVGAVWDHLRAKGRFSVCFCL